MRISDWSSDVCSSDLYSAGCDSRGDRQLWRQIHAITHRPLAENWIVIYSHWRSWLPVWRRGRGAVLGAGGGHNLHSRRNCALGGRASLQSRTRSCHLRRGRSDEHTSELQSLMRISYAVFCLKKK